MSAPTPAPQPSYEDLLRERPRLLEIEREHDVTVAVLAILVERLMTAVGAAQLEVEADELEGSPDLTAWRSGRSIVMLTSR